MKRFTVKDFISYNNPCFSCGDKINFRIGFEDLTTQNDASYLRPVVTPEYTEVDLRITYSDSLKLFIFHKTNKILTNDKEKLTKYLVDHKLFLSSFCNCCHTQVESQFLTFHVPQGYVEPVGISRETIKVITISNIYLIYSSFIDEKSILIVDKVDKSQSYGSALHLELPLLPKYRFKNREHFLEKVSTYITFS